MIRVAYFAFSEEYGGKHAGFTHSFNIIKSLSKLVNISAFFYCKDGPKTKDFEINCVAFPSLRNFFSINPVKYFSSYFFVRSNITNAYIVHERFHVNPVDLLFLKGKKYVLEINDPAMVLHDNFFYKFLINLKLRRCDFVITQTETLKKILSGFTSKPIHIVSNGVDTIKFNQDVKSNIRAHYGIKDNELLIVFVGAFMQWHGVEEIIEIAKRMPDAKFLMVGTGPEYFDVKSKSKNLKNIIFSGSVDNGEVPKFLSAADILIAPFNTKKFTKMETYGFWWCPVKVFEYMAAGKPIVSYDYTEVRKIVGGCGLLAKPGDFEGFLTNVKKLAENKKLRLRLGKKARIVSLKYDWKYRARDVYGVYKKCLEK